jgi:hypothetical protein
MSQHLGPVWLTAAILIAVGWLQGNAQSRCQNAPPSMLFSQIMKFGRHSLFQLRSMAGPVGLLPVWKFPFPGWLEPPRVSTPLVRTPEPVSILRFLMGIPHEREEPLLEAMPEQGILDLGLVGCRSERLRRILHN